MRRLRGIAALTRDEMRLAGYPDDVAEIDAAEIDAAEIDAAEINVCAGIGQASSP